MAVTPLFSGTPNNQVGGAVLGPTAVTAQDGTGSLSLIYQAGANGSYVDSVTLKPVGSPAQSLARLFLCTATGAFVSGTTNTAANTAQIPGETGLPAITSSNLNPTNDIVIPVRRWLGPNTKLLMGFATSTGAAGTGYAVATFGGDS